MSPGGLRLAHLTDLHITDNSRLADQAEVLGRIVRQCTAHGVQATLLTGDLYGRTVPHKSTPAERNVLFPAVRALAQLGPVIIIPGNHDYPGDLDALEQLGGGYGWPVVVQKRPQRLKVNTPGAPLHVYAVPWPTRANLLQGEGARLPPDQVRKLTGDKLDQLMRLWGSRVTRARRSTPDAVHVLAAHCMTIGARTSGGEVMTGREIEISRQGMEALGVDYGALGHMHYRQEVAKRCWYGGDPWRVDFGETDPKGWHLVDIGEPRKYDGEAVLDSESYPSGDKGEHPMRVLWVPTDCRDFVTLDWRWADDEDTGIPRWVTEPEPKEMEMVRGAEVRARLVVPQQWVAGCPWDQVLEELKRAGAHRVVSKKVIEPVHRVRAPAVAKAETPLDKLRAYWETLESQPSDGDKAQAQAMLSNLQGLSDEDMSKETRELLG